VVYNMDATERIFVQWGATTETTPTSMTVVSSTVIPALAAMTFVVGYLGDRPELAGDEADCLFFMAETGTNVQVNVTYLMGRGSVRV
jgi:hypothetical protein